MKTIILSVSLLIFNCSVVAQQTFGPLKLVEKITLDETQVLISDIQDVVVDSQNHIFLISWQSSNLIEYGPDGQPIGVHARRGKGPGELMMPQNINISDSGNLYVASLMGRVSKYHRNGDAFGEFIATEDHRPLTCVAVLKDSTIVVGGRNLYGNTLYSYDSKGKFSGNSFYLSNELYQNVNYQGYAGTYIAKDYRDYIYAIQSINFEVTAFDKMGKEVLQFGVPHPEFRKPIAFDKDLDETPQGKRRLQKSFTYYTDIWVDDGNVIVQSRNDIGDEERKFRYYVDIYDKKTQQVLTSGLQSDDLELEFVKDGKFYFLKEEVNSNSDVSITRIIYIYNYNYK